jgi:hypothetical protein
MGKVYDEDSKVLFYDCRIGEASMKKKSIPTSVCRNLA